MKNTAKTPTRRIQIGKVSRSTRGAITGNFEIGGLHPVAFLLS